MEYHILLDRDNMTKELAWYHTEIMALGEIKPPDEWFIVETGGAFTFFLNGKSEAELRTWCGVCSKV